MELPKDVRITKEEGTGDGTYIQRTITVDGPIKAAVKTLDILTEHGWSIFSKGSTHYGAMFEVVAEKED